MDEKADNPGPAPDPVPDSDEGAPAPSVSADRLVSRLAELRAQVDVLAPPDQDRGREAIERIRQAQERVATLELMLARAREREDSLTAQTVRDQAAIADGEARIAELGAIAARVAASEAARREEATAAAEAKRRLALAQTEAEAHQAEIARLRSRCSELETDLSGLAGEVAAAAIARAEASRTERERNEARDRAYAERRLAAEDRRRASEANLRATELQSQLRTAERRIVQLVNERSASEAEREAPPKVLESTGATSPWTTLQRESSAAARPPVSEAQTVPVTPAASAAPTVPATPPASKAPSGSDATPLEPAGTADIIDLTDEEASPVGRETGDGTAESREASAAWSAPHARSEGLLGRVLRGRRHDPETGGAEPPSAPPE
jgi:hypothetical protein